MSKFHRRPVRILETAREYRPDATARQSAAHAAVLARAPNF